VKTRLIAFHQQMRYSDFPILKFFKDAHKAYFELLMCRLSAGGNGKKNPVTAVTGF